jgi:hypothetical protein
MFVARNELIFLEILLHRTEVKASHMQLLRTRVTSWNTRPYVELMSCSWCDSELIVIGIKANNWLVSIQIKQTNFKPRPLYPRKRAPGTHSIGGWVDPRAGLDEMEMWKFLTLPGLEPRPLSRPARSQSLYRLRYPGSYSEDLLFIFYLCSFIIFWRTFLTDLSPRYLAGCRREPHKNKNIRLYLYGLFILFLYIHSRS